MEPMGTLSREGKRYVFTYPELDMVVRGSYAEWVLEAAAEIISEVEQHAKSGAISEIEALIEFEEASDIDLEIAKSEQKAQFETVPQCVVTVAEGDFRWISQPGREAAEKPIERLIDMSLTRNDTFLENEPDVGAGAGERGLE